MRIVLLASLLLVGCFPAVTPMPQELWVEPVVTRVGDMLLVPRHGWSLNRTILAEVTHVETWATWRPPARAAGGGWATPFEGTLRFHLRPHGGGVAVGGAGLIAGGDATTGKAAYFDLRLRYPVGEEYYNRGGDGALAYKQWYLARLLETILEMGGGK